MIDTVAMSVSCAAVIVALYSAIIISTLTQAPFWVGFMTWLSVPLNSPEIASWHPIYIAITSLISMLILRLFYARRHPSTSAQIVVFSLINAGIFAIIRTAYWSYRWIVFGELLEDPAGYHPGVIVMGSIAVVGFSIAIGLLSVGIRKVSSPLSTWLRFSNIAIASAVLLAALSIAISALSATS
ncbi:MAG: hypothetical protein WBA28_04460 [Microbacteriaceae bacterium]